MKKTTLLAAVLLLGASATGIGAAANNKLEGSDTLKDLTKEVLRTCAAAAGLDYVGGGSGTAEVAFVAVNPTQEIGPMSRFLGNGACRGGKNLTTAHGLVVAHDGLAIVTEGDGGANDPVCASGQVNTTGSIAVTKADGTPALNCPGCEPGTNTYNFKSPPTAAANGGWKDVLRLVYAGQTHDGTTLTNGTIDCASDVRRTLVNNFGSLFQGGCGSLGECSGGLNHAYRRDDLSGTTDTFASLVGLRTVGALATVPAFCNGFENEDKDPIRRECAVVDCTTGGQAFCDGNGGGTCVNSQKTGVKVCAGNANEDDVCNRDNKLGVVLPIFAPAEPDVDGNGTGDVPNVNTYYSMATCPAANTLKLQQCARFTNATNAAISFVCPDRPAGDGFNIAGATLTPVGPGNVPCLCDTNTARCKSTFTKAAPGTTYMDHRVFNLYVRAANGNVLINRPPGTAPTDKVNLAGQGNSRLFNINNAFFRLRSAASKPVLDRCALTVTDIACTSTADCLAGSTSEGALCIANKCTFPNSDTENIGCLSAVTDCSIGFSGKQAMTAHPDTKGLLLAKTSDGSAIALTNATALDLSYPLARKLYINSVVGLGNVVDPLEKALVSKVPGCFGDLATAQAAATKITFVPEAALTCDDFNETTCNDRACAVATQAADCKASAGSTCTLTGSTTAGNCSCTGDSDCLGGRTCVAGLCKYAANTPAACPFP